MKMGVKEFRERFSDVAEGKHSVLVTKNGRIVGKYDPVSIASQDGRDWEALEARLSAFREHWKATTPDWRERLARAGYGEDGELLDV
jgi:antitoxin (DNA-binding transcriptional repressor) of toxin-antitoxin stability system